MIESVLYPGVVARFLLLPAAFWTTASLGGLAYLSLIKKQTFSRIQLLGLVLLFLLLSLLTITLAWLEQNQFPNYVLSTFGIHLSSFRWLPFISATVVALAVIPKRSKLILSLLPFFLMIIMTVVRWVSPTFFLEAGVENGLVETGQNLALAASTFILFTLIWQHRRTHQKLYLSLLLVMLIGVIFLIGEEISWGQQILQFESHDFFQRNNLQTEHTLHNMRYVQDLLFNVYVIIGFFGSFGWRIRPFISKLLPKQAPIILRFIPPVWIATYFVPLFAYGVIRVIAGPLEIKTWEESVELVAYVGIMFTTYRHWQKRNQKLS